jgi:hypothetical protein
MIGYSERGDEKLAISLEPNLVCMESTDPLTVKVLDLA